MPGSIGKKLRSRKAQLAFERRQVQYSENINPEINKSEYNFLNFGIENYNINSLRKEDPKNKIYNKNAASYQNGKNPETASRKSSDSVSKKQYLGTYDTITSVHDIEQDDHYYYSDIKESQNNNQNIPLISIPTTQNFDRTDKLGRIQELPSKNITRNNSVSDILNQSNIKDSI